MKKLIGLILICFITLPLYAEKVIIWHKPGEPVWSKAYKNVSHQASRARAEAKYPHLVTWNKALIEYSDLPSGPTSCWEWDYAQGRVILNQTKLDALKDERKNLKDIDKEQRKLAIQSLKAQGKLPLDYPEE